mgnify:CR=1 FL=1|tara:strand:- start:106 stop:1161 length:1056 start_codon:yes stop_codon:yes gene_type:complete
MKAEIKFSICVPNYNAAKYLNETIDSVLNQTYPCYELIISDNASTDNSIDVIKSYRSKKIKLVEHNYNVGFSHNLDSATSIATGDYMIFLGADDMLKIDALEEFAKLIEKYSKHKNGLIICGMAEIIKNKEILGTNGPKGGDIEKTLKKKGILNISNDNPLVQIYSAKEIFRILMTTNFTTPGPVQAMCYSKKLFDMVNGYHSPTVMFPDASFGHKICLYATDIIYYEKSLAYFRVHDSAFTADIQKIKNIKLLTDKYLLSLEFTDKQLNSAGLSRIDLQKAFIKHWCINTPFYFLYSGRIIRAYYYFIFGFASYPLIMLRQSKMYLILSIFWLAPLFWIVGNLYRKFLKS